MNKKEFIRELALRTNKKQADCKAFFEDFQDLIIDILKRGETIKLYNFGKFWIKTKHSKRILNPQTQRYMITSQKFIPSFKSSKYLHEQIK